ncbi:MAG: hypothetical protein Q4G03_11290 [Planctomycetia bacterium]|nr:hypothetical protein [Planctomycetia bacterium]
MNQEFEKIVNSADMDSLAFLPSLQIAAVENDDQSKIGFLAYVVDRILNGYEVKS